MSKSARKDRIPLIEASDSTDIYRKVRSEFEFAKKVSAKVAGINKTDPATFDLEGCMEERRVRAVGNFIKENKDRGLTDDWIGLSVVFNGYSLLENNLHILLAAAIWILDRISETEIDFKEVYKLLPTDEDEVFDSLDTPELWDSQYDFALILSVEYVLHFRNRDIAPLERDGDGGDRVFTSMLLAQGKTHADVPSRQRFEKLLSLIPQDKIDAAVEHFKAYFWKWTDRTVKGQALLEEKCSKTRKEVNDIRVRINKMRDELDEMVAQFEKERKNTRKAIKSPLMPGIGKLSESMIPQGAPYSTATNGFISDPNQAKFNMALTALRKIEDENIELSKLYDEQCQKKRVFNSYISGFGALSEEDSKELYGQVIPELVAPLPIPDPFEMCFALLYLSDRDDDIPWLYGACHGAMVAATEYLPWACCDYEERHDKYWNGESNCSDNSSEMPDWYQKILENKASDVILSRMQYVYGMTGCLMPRDLHRYDNEIKVLEEYGLNSDQACGLLYPLLALSNIRRKKTARNLDPAYVAIMRMKETGEYPDFDEKTEEEKEIERLKASIYDLQKALKDTEQKLSEQKEASDAEHRELADLRELLFRGETDEQSETVADESVFPYEVQKDTVVFGGHETWVKAIKPLIKGAVRFVPKELVFDVSIIRHADVIWVQTNAISHKSYYRIIDVVKKYNKPIRYFQYASAVKCAEQVVMNDKE